MTVWRVRTGAIDECVRAEDQFAAWATLRERATADFGLVASAEPEESGDPIMVRTSALMAWWGRDSDAAAFVAVAVEAGLPDSTALDREFAQAHT